MHNGISPHDEDNANPSSDLATTHNGPNGDLITGTLASGTSNVEKSEEEISHELNGHPQTPSSPARGRKRKFSDTRSPKSKKISPPWKSFSADGPTSFKTEDGRRKSGRRNVIPLELQPQGTKRQTRGEYSKYQDDVGGLRNGETPLRGGKQRTVNRLGPYHATRKGNISSLDGTSYPKAATSNSDYQDDKFKSPSQQRRLPRHEASQRSSQRLSSRMEETSVTSNANVDVAQRDQRLRKRQTLAADTPRIMLRLGPRSVPILNPSNMAVNRKHESLKSWLKDDDPLEGEEERAPTEKEAVQEAKVRLRLIEASKPGGPLSKDSTVIEAQPCEEPSKGHTHMDYLVLHAKDLRQRMQREGREHRIVAKRLAQAAATAVRAKMPKTSEELEAEARARNEERLRTVLKQLRGHLEMASQKIMELKKQEYFDQEAAAGRERMKLLVDRSEGLLTARSAHHHHQSAVEWDREPDEQDSVSHTVSENEDNISNVSPPGSPESDDENLTREEDEHENDEDGDSSSTTDETEDNPDADLTIEELRAKYTGLPEIQDESGSHAEPETESEKLEDDISNEVGSLKDLGHEDENVKDELMPDLDHVDDILLDDQDEDSDSSGTITEDESEGSNGEDDDANSEAESEAEQDPRSGLLGFLTNDEIGHLRAQRNQSDEASPHNEKPTVDKPTTAGLALKEPSDTPTEKLRTPSNASPARADGPVLHQSRPASVKEPSDEKDDRHKKLGNVQTQATGGADLNDLLNYTHQNAEPQLEIPPLIRGNLRPYQHAGFEWLAGMYGNATNGILADEMGLGKTFQTIALLAHLATRHHVWGPHLIVVPTSVILNWEIEFKKFLPGFKVLPYYGSQDERKEKRKGWKNDDKWNVVITSYQLAISDQAVLKRRRWHYLVLDEAHNIKNHKSQRWQTLLSFRSEARLLLTGTPLQNNLAELWSLLFFLAPEQDEEGGTSFGDLTQFSKVFHRPVDQILENGRGALDKEGIEIVSKLHQVLRPHLLRRLKADVEKQMPKKYEHVTICRLSKRQRQLYDGYMGLAGTRDSFASGNYMSIINCLMQLRKVCNHPDLFETRQIVTSFAMPKSVVADYDVKELLIRKRLLQDGGAQSDQNLINLWQDNTTSFATVQARQLNADGALSSVLAKSTDVDISSHDDALLTSAFGAVLANQQHLSFGAVHHLRHVNNHRMRARPIYSEGLLGRLRLKDLPFICSPGFSSMKAKREAFLDSSSVLRNLVQDIDVRSSMMEPLISRFCCTTPNVTAPGMSRFTLTDYGMDLIQASDNTSRRDAFHEVRVRLSIAFPDKSLIQYDCGKLQQLDRLLRKLQSGGHRAVIFTQMTKVLDILEQFMNLHGHRYLRLDGATKIEQRQIITERFNTDTRILAFISSSRSGGLGINLTGADTVIFYDLDWNPAMDKQCQDRCHRIGQTRDVHIYRFVSEGTIEANILKKSNQKRMLDDVVIQEGDFTTEYFNKLGANDGNEDTDAAIDKVFGGGSTRMLQQAEDREDQEAAKEAQKEELQADDADFGEKAMDRTERPETPQSATPSIKPVIANEVDSTGTAQTDTRLDRRKSNPEGIDPAAREQLLDHFASNPLPQDKPVFRDVDEDGNACPGGCDDYMIRFKAWELRDITWVPPRSAQEKKKKKKGSEFGIRR
ncbi:MAG: hypothetical protein Q9159_004748 [Coniocarpon cinnabarinum]